MSASHSPPPPSSRQLSLIDCFGIGINGIIGSGIFLLPASVHRRAGGHAPLAWLLVGGLCSLVALCFAEAAARTERSGGPYRYACDAFGPYVGFGIGWITLISAITGYTAVARGFGQTAAAVLGHPKHVPLELCCAVTVVACLTLLNILGVRLGSRTGAVVSIIKLAALLSFVAIGLFFADWHSLSAAPAPDLAAGESAGLLGAAFAGFFATTGFEYVPVPAGEVKDPRRTIPLAMVTSILGATLLYMAVQAVAGAVYPDLGRSTSAVAEAAGHFGGPRGRALMGIAGMISAFGFCAGSALVGPRYLETFAIDRFLPGPLALRSARFATPVVAVVTLGVLVVSMLLATGLGEKRRFDSLADTSNVAVVIQYMATAVAVLVLRRKSPAPAGAFVIPAGPLVPLLALAGSGLFLFFVGRTELYSAGRLIVVGLTLGMLWRWRKSRAG